MNLLKFTEHKKPLFLFHSFTLGNKLFREQPTDFVEIYFIKIHKADKK
jgi:hypothetical protein